MRLLPRRRPLALPAGELQLLPGREHAGEEGATGEYCPPEAVHPIPPARAGDDNTPTDMPMETPMVAPIAPPLAAADKAALVA